MFTCFAKWAKHCEIFGLLADLRFVEGGFDKGRERGVKLRVELGFLCVGGGFFGLSFWDC